VSEAAAASGPSGVDDALDESTAIAVVGMSGRFAGAPDVDALWRLVRDGEDGLSDLSEDELLAAGVDGAVLAQPEYVRRTGVLADLDRFDAAFFGIGPRDAAIMDPQHRHFYECAWSALEAAGHVPERFDGAIGVFGGCGQNTYLLHNLLTSPGLLDRLGWFLLRHTANDKDFLTTGVSYRLDLQGPSVNVQTACSTSLVAIHLAVQSLLSLECDLALAGGSTIEVPERVGYVFHEGEILSPDGHCRAFDEQSGGTVLTSGVGVVALRRLSDALADGDPVLAVIRGSAVNNDGSRKVGYLAPSVDGHAAVVREALAGRRDRRRDRDDAGGARHRDPGRGPDRGRGADGGVPGHHRRRRLLPAHLDQAEHRAHRHRGRRRERHEGGAGAAAPLPAADGRPHRAQRPAGPGDHPLRAVGQGRRLGRRRDAAPGGRQLARRRRDQRPRGARGGAAAAADRSGARPAPAARLGPHGARGGRGRPAPGQSPRRLGARRAGGRPRGRRAHAAGGTPALRAPACGRRRLARRGSVPADGGRARSAGPGGLGGRGTRGRPGAAGRRLAVPGHGRWAAGRGRPVPGLPVRARGGGGGGARPVGARPAPAAGRRSAGRPARCRAAAALRVAAGRAGGRDRAGPAAVRLGHPPARAGRSQPRGVRRRAPGRGAQPGRRGRARRPACRADGAGDRAGRRHGHGLAR
jgi:hypothetical protein